MNKTGAHIIGLRERTPSQIPVPSTSSCTSQALQLLKHKAKQRKRHRAQLWCTRIVSRSSSHTNLYYPNSQQFICVQILYFMLSQMSKHGEPSYRAKSWHNIEALEALKQRLQGLTFQIDSRRQTESKQSFCAGWHTWTGPEMEDRIWDMGVRWGVSITGWEGWVKPGAMRIAP